MTLSIDAVEIYAPSEIIALALRRYKKDLAKWASQFKKNATRIFFPSCKDKPFEIPAFLSSSLGDGGDDLLERLSNITREDALEDLKVLERLIRCDLPAGIADLESDDMIWANPQLIQLCQAPAVECSSRNVRSQWDDAGSSEALEAVKINLRQGSKLENHAYRCLLNPGGDEPFDFRSDYEAIWLPGRQQWVRFAIIRQAEPVLSVV